MNKLFALPLLLTALNCVAGERSVTFYSEPNFLGTRIDIEGSSNLMESIFDYQLNYVPTSLDMLQPINENNVSSLEVMPGYCLAFGQDDFVDFNSGGYAVFNPGVYSNLGAYDNKMSSFATYKMLGSGQTRCNPKVDVPSLYSNDNLTGSTLPLVPNNGKNATIEALGKSTNSLVWTIWDVIQKNSVFLLSKRAKNNIIYIVNGASSPVVATAGPGFVAQSLYVPACYEVALTKYRIYADTPIQTNVFKPGSYKLSTYGLARAVESAVVTVTPNCVQPGAVVVTPPPAIVSYPPIAIPPSITFASPRRDGYVLGGVQHPNAYWPSEGMERVATDTANQFCKENGYANASGYTTRNNYGAGHAYYEVGNWFTYGGVGFVEISSVSCVSKPIGTTVLQNYPSPLKNGLLMGHSTYKYLLATADKFCKDQNMIGVDYMGYSQAPSTLPQGTAHYYYPGYWATDFGTNFLAFNQIRCYR